MKVIIVGPAHPLRGGLATFNERLAYALQEQQHDVSIYSYALQYPGFLFPGQTQFTDEPAPEGLNIRTIINSVNPLNWLRTGNALAREKADIILVRYWLPFFGPALGTILRRVRKKSPGTKIICLADNIIPHEKRIGDLLFTRYFVKPIQGFLTMSQSVLKDLAQFAQNQPAQYTPHPLYDNFGAQEDKRTARAKLGIPADEKAILFFGLIRKYKGLDILLEAMADPRIRQRGIKLIVAGEFYDKKEGYEQIIQEQGLADLLYLHTRFIPNSEVGTYFSAADIVVQPYRNATQSGVTQICFHFDKPMIVTDVGGLSESIPDGKVGYVSQVNPADIADKIVRFYDEDKEAEFVAAVQEEKKQYSWSYFIDALLSVAKQI